VPFADYSDAKLGAVISLVKHGGLTGALERFMDAEGKPPTHTPSTAEVTFSIRDWFSPPNTLW